MIIRLIRLPEGERISTRGSVLGISEKLHQIARNHPTEPLSPGEYSVSSHHKLIVPKTGEARVVLDSPLGGNGPDTLISRERPIIGFLDRKSRVHDIVVREESMNGRRK